MVDRGPDVRDPARSRRLTEGLPGLLGRIREEPEDFVVEEIPLYAPTGEGDHVLFGLEKRGISTFEALLWVSKSVQVSEHQIGYAGLKDAHAVTRQLMSVHRVPPGRVLALRRPNVRVLWAERHPTRVRIGHLKGNRFTIRIRGARTEHLGAAREALGRLAQQGVPNAYGVQRFGTKQDGHLMGRALLRGDYASFLSHLAGRPDAREGDVRVREAREAYDRGDVEEALSRFPMKHRAPKKALATLLRTGDPKQAFEALGKRPRRIYVSAYQSWLFNRCLDARLATSTVDRLLPGDLAWLHRSGALFDVRDAALEEARASRLEASPTGPLPGYDMRRPSGEMRAQEQRILDEEGLADDLFRAPGIRTRGSRRPYRVPLVDASLDEEGPETVVARFTLPPGSFATVVLDELMKGGTDASATPRGEDPGAPEPPEALDDEPEGDVPESS